MTPEEIIKTIDAEAEKTLKKIIRKIYGIVVVRMAQSTFDKAQFQEPENLIKKKACICWGTFAELPTVMGNGMIIRKNPLPGLSDKTLCMSLTNIWPIVIDPDIDHGKAMISVWDIKGRKYVPED